MRNNRLDTNTIYTNVAIDITSIVHSSIESYDTKYIVNKNYRIYNNVHKEFNEF